MLAVYVVLLYTHPQIFVKLMRDECENKLSQTIYRVMQEQLNNFLISHRQLAIFSKPDKLAGVLH